MSYHPHIDAFSPAEALPVSSEKPMILIPFLGKLSDFALLSLRMLGCSADRADIVLLSDQPSPTIEGISHVDFRSAFAPANPLGISYDALLAYPYKICDLKPFLNLIFPQVVGAARRWGWADIDCLYSRRILEPLSARASNGPPSIFGQFGHFLVGESDAFDVTQAVFLEADRREPSFAMFDPHRHLALDEFLFLHVVLTELEKSGLIAWERRFPISIGDVEPFHRLPVVGGQRFASFHVEEGRLFGRPLDGEDVEFDYIHVQKRRVEIDRNLGPDDAMLFYPEADGCMRLARASASTAVSAAPDALADLRFFLKCNSKRLRQRFANHGFGPRPHLTAEGVRSIVQELRHHIPDVKAAA